MRLALRLGCVLSSVTLLAPLPALAQTRANPPSAATAQDQARSKAREALKLYEGGSFGDAYAAFRSADTLFHAPSIAIYIARCQRKLGKLLEARETYETILAEELPKDASPAFLKAHVDAGTELGELKARIPWLRVLVMGIPSGTASITLDGVALSGERKDLDPATYTLRVNAPGCSEVVRSIKLEEAGHETATIDMQPERPSPQPPPVHLAPNRVPAFVSIGVGGASLIAGVVLGSLALVQSGDLESKCGGGAICTPPKGTSYPREQLDRDQRAMNAKGWAANVTLGVGIVGIALGVTLYALGVPKASDPVVSAGAQGIRIRF